jgi:ribosome-binding factor A
MERRIEKINNLIKEEVSKIIRKEVDFPKTTLVTITRVETNKDLTECRVFFSCYPESKFDEALKILEKEIYFIQGKLNKKLILKRVPLIRFKKEKKVVEAAKIEEILEKLKGEKK